MSKENERIQAAVQEMEEALRRDPRVQALHRVSFLPYMKAALCDWGCIVGAAALAEWSGSWLLYGCACLVIAARQHALLVLSHDGAHYRLSPHKFWNDLFSNGFFAYPILFDTDGYRTTHADHHAYLNSERDPDWARKLPHPQWQFPMALSFVRRNWLRFVLWNGPKEWIYVMLHLARVLPLKNLRKKESLRRVGGRLLYYSCVAVAVSYLSLWRELFLYWVVPLLFVFPSLQRIRSVAEHFGLARVHDLNQSRTILAPWYESFFLGPRNINYHLAHHLIPGVPFYKLPKLQEILEENPVYQAHAHQNSSYLLPSDRPLIRDLFSDFESSSGEGKEAA